VLGCGNSRAMTRLRSVFARIDPAHRRATVCDGDADGTSVLSSGRLRHEMTLCVLFETRDRLGRNKNALEQSRRRLEATKRLTQSAHQRGFQLHPSSSGCLSIPLGITPQHTTEARPFSLRSNGWCGSSMHPMARCEP
jgi:hypothetical protein